MIYLIPKCFKQKKEFIELCFKYIDSVNSLDIEYQPQKSFFPRLKKSKKRGKQAVIEILSAVSPNYFSDQYHLINELIDVLKWGLKRKEYKGMQVLTITNTNAQLFDTKYFPLSEWSHIPETEIDLLNNKIHIMSNNLMEESNNDMDTKPIDIIKSHINNYIFTDEERFDLIKYISLN